MDSKLQEGMTAPVPLIFQSWPGASPFSSLKCFLLLLNIREIVEANFKLKLTSYSSESLGAHILSPILPTMWPVRFGRASSELDSFDYLI